MWYWLGLCVSPYILGHFPFRKLQHSLAMWQRLWSLHFHIQDCRCQEKEQLDLPPFISMESPCLLTWWSPSLVPRLSILHLPDRHEAPFHGHTCHSPHGDMGHPQCSAHCDKATSSPGVVSGDHVGPRQPLATQGKRVASSLCPWPWRASSSLEDREGVQVGYLICPIELWQLSRGRGEEHAVVQLHPCLCVQL